MRAPSTSILLSLIAVSSLAGCTEEFVGTVGGGGTTSSSGGGTGGTAGSGGQTTTSSQACDLVTQDPCNECLVDACAQPYCSCAMSGDCLGLIQCDQKAVSISDFEQCWLQHPDSISLAGRLQNCGAKHCTACGLPPVDKCLGCEYDKCGPETNSCFGNEKCLGLLGCLKPCPGSGDPTQCQMKCYEDFSQGVQPLQALYNCASNFCVTPCTM